MSDLPTKGERTRQAIITAAYSLFLEQGYHATSMRQIAQRAELALGGIYNHFSSKEEIFDQVLLEKHPYHQVLQILQTAPGESIGAFVHNAARTMTAELGRRPDFIKLVFIELSEFKGKHAPQLFQSIFPQILPLVTRFEGDRSELRDIPSQAILLSYLGMFFAFYVTESVINPGGSLPPNPQVLEQYLDIFLHGILKSPAGNLEITSKPEKS
jgi:AcrR family transcriptional regulator